MKRSKAALLIGLASALSLSSESEYYDYHNNSYVPNRKRGPGGPRKKTSLTKKQAHLRRKSKKAKKARRINRKKK